MGKFKALLKFEFMNNSPNYKVGGAFSRLKNLTMLFVGVAAFLLIYVYGVNALLKVFISAGMQNEFLTIFSFLIMVLIVAVGVTMATKVLFTKVDLSIIKLPVNGGEVFLAKLIYLFVKMLELCLILVLPTLIIFGIKTAQSTIYFLNLLPSILFLPIVPLLAAVLLSVPVMWVINIFKNKFIVLLLFYTLTLVAGFLLYIFALKFILKVLESGNFANVFDSSTIYSIRQFTSYLYLPMLFKNILIFYNFWKSLAINLALTLILCAIIYVFAKNAYYNLLISSKNQKVFYKRTKVVPTRPEIALFKKDIKNIFRSTNYAFQYLTIVFTTPLLVYFSSEIVSSVGAHLLGTNVLPGIVVLILIMYLSIGTSFSATSITREGGNFFLTKIIPVSIKKQIFVKFLIYIIISVPAIFISCLALALAGFINYVAAVLIAISLSFVVVGNICHSIVMDIKRPQFASLENGEVSSNNKNISASISIGFIISFIMGIGGIIISLFVNLPSMYLVLFGFGVPYAIIESFRLFFRLEKRYNNIEV